MKIGFTCSAFDLLHAGHVQMLRNAKEQCEYLIVGLQVDPQLDRPSKNAPIQTIVERYTQLQACSYVDEIVPYSTERDLTDILSMYDIDVRILGEEYKDKEFTGRDLCRKRGMHIYFNERSHRFSSSDLRQRVVDNQKEVVYNKPTNEVTQTLNPSKQR
jgi:glycerol-3-phosphate cytidylyltransferase|tara:strand:- start:12619 stop:13095 length:477 start_codon:yes stop_codon:yes gene_type:complete